MAGLGPAAEAAAAGAAGAAAASGSALPRTRKTFAEAARAEHETEHDAFRSLLLGGLAKARNPLGH